MFVNGSFNNPDIVGQIAVQNLFNQQMQLSLSNGTLDFNKNNIVFGFSVMSDANYIKSECERYRKEIFDYSFIDIQRIFTDYKELVNTPSLINCAHEYGVTESQDVHRSDDDSYFTMCVLKGLCKETGLSPLELIEKYPQKGLWFEDVPEPQVSDNDVKIKIHKTAICGTDLHIYNWDEWSQKTIVTPRVIGHEYVGEIAEVGKNVTNWKIGEIVSGEGHIVCGKCRNCLAGNGHLCKETVGVGVNRDGAFAEYLVIPQENVRRCEKDIPEEMYSIFAALMKRGKC